MVCVVWDHRQFPTEHLSGPECQPWQVSYYQGVYQATWDLDSAGVPIGKGFQVSFDVYGSEKDQQPENLSPNGIHYGERVPFSCLQGPDGVCQ